MTNIAIVDDDAEFLIILKNKLLALDNELKIFCYLRPYDFMENINNINYLLLDIELPQINGISLSKQLRKNNISIFFITSYKELMIKAFGKNVEGFILKEDLDKGITNFIHHIYKQKEENSISVLSAQNIIKLYFDEILFISYTLRDVEYFLINSKKIIQKNKNLKDIAKCLNDDFFMVNRNIIININYVDSLKNGYVFIRNHKIKVSRRKIKDIKIKLLERRLNNED